MRCCIVLGKTQHEIESEYAWIDLPQLLHLTGERRARELIENIQVSSFPHYTEETRKDILKGLQAKMPKLAKEPPKSAEDQYQALLARMKVGG
ncbi:hypothetical protein COLU111180_04085 [Cohnella lubricantis]|uniref:Uncharacterized protein n=1 Tax=Cohnella lubricantis TaxID=2163172 RepID=A0A841T6J9_9BACL|nr:hypothetical protein [Cohnella lubricantis]MBB6676512.1 hypothetical protein [Cohnella lubricantis]MBP2117132.1 hypothetical protein [Cohnella lubricantis]